jgi:hypothetical protein
MTLQIHAGQKKNRFSIMQHCFLGKNGIAKYFISQCFIGLLKKI